MSFDLDPRRTALVVIDPMAWTLALARAPRTGEDVAYNAARLAWAIRPAGPVILTRAVYSEGYVDQLHAPVDLALKLPEEGMPDGALAFHPGLDAAGYDLAITKRQWSAFYGTELDLQLRRRGIDTVVICGVMTNFGVESTARDAWQHNYAVVIPEDACASLDAEMHRFSVERILPRVGRVRSTAEIVEALGGEPIEE